MRPVHYPSTQGRPVREKRAGGFRLLEVVHDARVHLLPHSHDHASLCIVLQGGFQEWMDGVPFDAAPACLLVEPRSVPHRSWFGATPTRSLILEVESPELDARLRAVGPLLDTPSLLRSARLTSIGHLLAAELRLGDEAASLAVEGLALELVAAASRLHDDDAGRLPPRWLRQVADELATRFREPLRLEELAQAAGVHPVHLARAFRRHFGESVGERVRRLRLHWCAERLGRSDVPVATIAVEGGFCDQSHLARMFKLEFGCSPTHYRRAHRGR